MSKSREECGRELVLLFLNALSSTYTKAEYNEAGRERHLPCNTARHTITRDVCDFIIRRPQVLRRETWSVILYCPPYPYLLLPSSFSTASKSMSRKAKFAFGDGWPLVTAFPIIITALIAHKIFSTYLFFAFPMTIALGFASFSCHFILIFW